jgi:hypothetical protein
MAYRGERPQAERACARHAAAEAVASCVGCAAALCEPCQVFDGPEPFCRDCAATRRRRRRRARAIVLGAGGAAMLFAVVAIRVTHWQYARAYAARVAELAGAIEQAPCDEVLQLELVRALESSHDRDGERAAWRAYTGRCGVGLWRRVTGRQKGPE